MSVTVVNRMRINVASLVHAHENPGHLPMGKMVILGETMGECPLGAFTDLLTEIDPRKRKERKK